MILFILSIVFGVTYVVLDNWSCRTGFILHASILCCVTFLIMLSAATTAQFPMVLATTIIVLLTRYKPVNKIGNIPVLLSADCFKMPSNSTVRNYVFCGPNFDTLSMTSQHLNLRNSVRSYIRSFCQQIVKV